VQLLSLHHPADPVPTGSPDFSAFEGQVRYVRLIRDSNGNPITDCLDSTAFQTTYKCATLGCSPEVTGWTDLFGGYELFVTGDAIVPDSTYRIQRGVLDPQLACQSSFLDVTTGRWGDTQVDGLMNIADVVAVVDRVKDAFGAIPESAALLHPAIPTPDVSSPNVLDVTLEVDALKLVAYPFTISNCP